MSDGLCAGEPLWDNELSWNTTDPELSNCFIKTVLVYSPCALLWLLLPLEYMMVMDSKDRLIPWSGINITKLLCSGLLMVTQIMDFVYQLDQNMDDSVNIMTSDIVAPIVLFLTILLQTILVAIEKKRGLQTSPVLWVYWTAIMLCGIPQYRISFRHYDNNTMETLPFVTYNVYYPLTIVMFVLFSIADATPTQLHKPRGPKTSPQLSASFLSQLTFVWLEPLIFKGFRKPLEQEDLYDLREEYTSAVVVKNWESNWEKSKEKARRKNIKKGGDTSEPPFVSVLPTMIKTFWVEFVAGTFIKYIYDVLSFVSPWVLNEIIQFTEHPDQPEWQGFMYVLVMFANSLLMSFLMGQYSIKMYLVGQKMRTGITAAVYRKSLRISSAARKESTVGEIVNLMSVDAQRFMDLTTYLNMLFSAPLIIILCMYFLWQVLGPSSMAGLVTMVLLIPLSGYIAGLSRGHQVGQMKYKDQRVKMMNEILNGMKVLKLYAWEPSFEDQVLNIREKEMHKLKRSAYLNTSTTVLFSITPFLIQFFMFMTYVLVDPTNQLTADKIFVSISLMNLMQMPMFMIPFLMVALVQSSVSLQRLNKFLNAEELDPLSVTHDYNEDVISIKDGTFAWGVEEEDKDILQDIQINVKPGSLVAVIGVVGSGKTSLCSALLGDMINKKGSVNVRGTLAYVAQQAWIQNTTLKENITFGAPEDEARYRKVIRDCALEPDLKILPGGDTTEIGEKGINLSGGQKQRVSLARAVFANTDVYILDDPLSAVDAHVGKHIFNNVIGDRGSLSGKTRILVTHAVTYLPRVDHIVVMKDGRISEQGSYQQLLDCKGNFQDFLEQYLAEGTEEEDPSDLEEITKGLEKAIGKDKLRDSIRRRRTESEASGGSLRRRSSARGSIRKPPAPSEVTPLPLKPAKGQTLIEKEKSQTGTVGWRVYLVYMRSVGLITTLLYVSFFTISQVMAVLSRLWLTKWSEDDDSIIPEVRDKYLGVYAGLGLSQGVMVLFGSLIMIQGTIRASRDLNRNMLGNILRSPMSFFDVTPIGRILNRFSKDIDMIDVMLPMNLRNYIQILLMILGIFAVIIYSTPIFAAVIVPLLLLYYLTQVLYITTSRQLKRIESVTRSPIYSHFGETVQGAATIRAYSKEQDFILQSELQVDINQMSYTPNIVANRWLSFRLELVGNVLTTGAAIFSILARKNDISSGLVGLSISYAQSVTSLLYMMVRMASETETNIVSVERVREYTHTPREAAWIIPDNRPPKGWPEEGEVTIEKFSTRYREGLDLVVKDVDCSIHSGEKVGIVGRTGAGKSSLTLALFRIIEAAAGRITIDGVDIASIGLHDLRKRLAIIPQDPVLFSGTLRMNLDPSEMYEDSQVWTALEQAHLKAFVTELNDGLQHTVQEGGENFSVGQRQLVCLGRALLRKTRILVLDEATAAVDLETDDLIQKTIRDLFADCTVITIAHRINTIMDNDKILVLDQGMVKEYGSPTDLLQNKTSAFYSMAKDAGLVQ